MEPCISHRRLCLKYCLEISLCEEIMMSVDILPPLIPLSDTSMYFTLSDILQPSGALCHLQPRAGAHPEGERCEERRERRGPGELRRVPAEPPSHRQGASGGAALHPYLLAVRDAQQGVCLWWWLQPSYSPGSRFSFDFLCRHFVPTSWQLCIPGCRLS